MTDPDPGWAGGRDRPPRGARPPTEIYAELGRKYNLSRHRLSRALHAIKDSAGLPADADTLIDATGNVYVAATGEPIGNLRDEPRDRGSFHMAHDGAETDDTEAVLVILSETDTAEQLAAAVGLTPDRSWNRGDVRPVSKLAHPYSGIKYFSRVPPTAKPGTHLDDLLDRLAPVKGRVAALSARLAEQSEGHDRVRLSVLHQTTDPMPGYDFSPQQLTRVAEMAAWLSLSVDVFAAEIEAETRTGRERADARELATVGATVDAASVAAAE